MAKYAVDDLHVRHHARSGSPGSTLAFTAFLVLVAVYFVIPLAWLLVSMTKSQIQLFSTGIFTFPHHLNLVQNFTAVSRYQGGRFWRWFGNSIGYSVVIATFATLFSAAAGYSLAKHSFSGKNVVFWLVLVSLMIPGAVSVIPVFIMERSAGLLNSYLGVILPQLVSPFGVYFMRIYIGQTMPGDLIDAARIDGASDIRTFFSIALPVNRPGLITLFLIVFVGSWNNFFLPFLLLSSSRLFPLSLGLYSWLGLISQHTAGVSYDSLLIMGSAISVVPMLILFPFLSRYIGSGLAQGSIKI